jgi:glycosidase
MPDLNYRSPAVRAEMAKVVCYWATEAKVDGFRLVAIQFLVEEKGRIKGTAATLAYLETFRKEYKAINPDLFTVGEIWEATSEVARYVDGNKLDMGFEFRLADSLLKAARTGETSGLKAKLREVKSANPFLQYAPFLSNHDQNRVFDQLGRDLDRMQMAAFTLLSLPGAPFMYYGEEIGMMGI